MSVFTLAFSCLTASNLPWFMDVTFQIPLQYWSYSIRFYFHHKSHPQLGTVFALALFLCSFWSFFFTDLQYHNGHLLTWGLHLSVSYPLSFHTLHGVLNAKILKWFATRFSSRPLFLRTLYSDPSILGGPTWCGSQFHWVRQGCGPWDQTG